MKKVTISLIALAGVLLACNLTSAVMPTADAREAASSTRVIKQLPTATPVGGLTILEAWQRAKPQAQAWAPDARLGVKWFCQGVLTQEGRCNGWSGLVGSASHQAVAELDVIRDGEVEFEPIVTHPSVVEEVLVAPFTPEEFLDSPAIMQRARAWLAAEGLHEEKTYIKGLALKSHRDSLEYCQLSSATAVYILETRRPSGKLCLDPYSGSVIFSNMW
jgi:hypothetical protein